MHRCWRLSAAPGTLRWISPANSVGSLIWTESQPRQTDLWTKSPQIREMAYQSLVHSQLEYASAVWDLYTKDRTNKVEMALRRAAWWTLSDYTRTNSVTSLQSQLNWQTLEGKWSVAGLCLFYKFVNGLVAVLLPDYMRPTHRISRYCHSMTFHQIHTCKDYYKYSFFPLAIVQSNALQTNVQLPQVFRSSRQFWLFIFTQTNYTSFIFYSFS